MKTALLIIDIQNDYFPGGKNPLEGSPQAAGQAARMLAFFREHQLPRFHIQHLSTRPGATFFVPGTDGAEIHEQVQPQPGEALIQKHFPNSFRDTPLAAELHNQGITRLVICGMMTHMCVEATTRAAVDLGFEALVAQDACATKTLTFAGQPVPAAQVHGAFLAALQGTYARVLPADEILGELDTQVSPQ
ncbi:MAG: cysteine hydrolase family protein [Chloroflexota bacterium]